MPSCYARYPMGWLWRALWVALVLSARPAFGGECTVSLVGGEPALQHLNAEARLRFIHERLRIDAHHAASGVTLGAQSIRRSPLANS